MRKTPLEKIQAKIDRCNGKNGCNSMCSKEQQAECHLRKAHSARTSSCREAGIDIAYW